MTRTRRGRGEGAVYQRKDGRWTVEVSIGYAMIERPDGAIRRKRMRSTLYGATKAEVLEKLATTDRTTLRAGLKAHRLTTSEYLDKWMATHEIRVTTRRRYEDLIARCIKPHIGPIRLASLEPLHIQAMLNELGRSGGKRTPSMVFEITRAAMRQAVRWRYIRLSPCDGVEPPRKPKRQYTVLTREECGRFLAAAEADRLGALYVLAALTGARQGELLGLKWPDVDLQLRTMTIRRTLVETKGHFGPSDEAKTEQSTRVVELPQRAVLALQAHRKAMLAERHLGAPVFCTTEGGWTRKPNLRNRSFLPLLKAAGLPVERGERIRFHDLRHGIATYLLEQDVHPGKVAKLLGHSSPRVTMEIYSHVLRPQMREVADMIDATLTQKPEIGRQSPVKKP